MTTPREIGDWPRRRLAAEVALPPYSYVPGRLPHPITDPRGHSYGHRAAPLAVPASGDWLEVLAYRTAVDLFHYGYYWEAHEAWEAVWNALGRAGHAADFVKGLIKLAAAGVKAAEGNCTGARRHALRAAELCVICESPEVRQAMRYSFHLDPTMVAMTAREVANAAEVSAHRVLDELSAVDIAP